MDNLVWMTKSKSAANRESAADITISRTKTKNGQKQSSITFRNNCFLKFAVGDYMVFAVTKTRVYFKEADAKEGFKLSKKHEFASTRYMRTALDLSEYIGDYSLSYDGRLKVHYIDINENELAYNQRKQTGV